MSKRVAVIMTNYKLYAEKYLAACLEGLRRQDYQGEIKIFMVDNESTEASRSLLKQYGPEMDLIVNETNDGFAKGNNDGIKKAMVENFDYFFLLNTDTEIEPDCISKLVEAMEVDPEIGAAQARLMLWPETDKINSLGNITHFLGFGYSVGYQQKFKIQNSKFKISPICYPSGAAVMLKREALDKVGLFDEIYWMYNEDQDLGWRLWLAGYTCNLIQDAVVYHKYEFSRSITKFYWMDRNRLITIIKNYRLATLILVVPALLAMELGLLIFAWGGGWLKEKVRVYKFFLKPGNWKHLVKERRHNQSLRKIKDRQILHMFTGRIWYQEIDDWKLRVANPVFDLYFWLLKKIVIW